MKDIGATMNSLGIGISIFFVLFCSSLIGSLMKRFLDVIHLPDATKDIVNAARGL
jgi:Na+-translocating ferredoxin:NAD+ oxidoreductase RnfE subunit